MVVRFNWVKLSFFFNEKTVKKIMQSTVKKNCSLSYLALFPKGKKDFFFIVKVLLYGSLERKKTVFFIFLPFLHISKHFGPHRSFGLHILLSQPKILNFLNKKKNHFTHFFERKYAEMVTQVWLGFLSLWIHVVTQP